MLLLLATSYMMSRHHHRQPVYNVVKLVFLRKTYNIAMVVIVRLTIIAVLLIRDY